MSVPRYTVSETEPSDEQVARWQAELSRDRAAVDRTPVAVLEGAYSLPLVVSRDGAVHQLLSQPVGEGDRQWVWQELPPIPGSQRAVSGDYWPEREGRLP